MISLKLYRASSFTLEESLYVIEPARLLNCKLLVFSETDIVIFLTPSNFPGFASVSLRFVWIGYCFEFFIVKTAG